MEKLINQIEDNNPSVEKLEYLQKKYSKLLFEYTDKLCRISEDKDILRDIIERKKSKTEKKLIEVLEYLGKTDTNEYVELREVA